MSMNITSDYDLRSFQHEQRMLDLYRRGSASDGGLLEPLANACWRAAAFDWRLHEDSGAIRRLWEEAARALSEGFVRRRAGFERSPEELLLAVHFSVASRAFDLVRTLIHTIPAVPSGARGRRIARSTLLLLDGYLSIARAVVDRKREHARAAQVLLEEARTESDYDWWKQQFPTSREVAWKIDEHEATRGLLSVIARLLVKQDSRWEENPDYESNLDMAICVEFMSLMDQALLSLDRFMESEINHRPKLYFWLPGIALTVLAERAGLPLEWLEVREEDNHKGYARLPLKLVHQ
jgi:hypothetical protein